MIVLGKNWVILDIVRSTKAQFNPSNSPSKAFFMIRHNQPFNVTKILRARKIMNAQPSLAYFTDNNQSSYYHYIYQVYGFKIASEEIKNDKYLIQELTMG